MKPETLSRLLVREIEKHGYTVVDKQKELDPNSSVYFYEQLSDGWTDPVKKIIAVDLSKSQLKIADTLAHELGHLVSDHLWTATHPMDRGEQECEAQFCSDTIFKLFELDNPYTLDYCTSWGSSISELQLKRAFAKGVRGATKIVDGILEERIAA